VPTASSFVTFRAYAGRTVGLLREEGKHAFQNLQNPGRCTDPKEALLNGKILCRWRLAGGNGYPGIGAT
jgi:hypothetical protein